MVSTTSRDDLIGRRASMMITFCGLVLVLASTISPYDFCFKETNNSLVHNILILGWGKSTVWDVFINVVVFLPLGFGLTGCLMQIIRLTGLTSLLVTILVCFGVSYVIEVLQLFMPSRFPSLIDVLSNCTGGILGFLCFFCWKVKSKS